MTTTTQDYLAKLVTDAQSITIVSGEGDGAGDEEEFAGVRTVRAIRSRLTRERCGGDRWSYAELDGQRCDEL